MENINNIVTPEVPIISQPPKKNIFKYLFIISIFILLIVTSFFIFVLKNINSKTSITKQNNNIIQTSPTFIPQITPTPTIIPNNLDFISTWKTYINEEWGLNFKYPSTYIITKNNIGKVGTFKAGELVLEDKTRNGNPTLNLFFNPESLGCILDTNDFSYSTDIKNNRLIITKEVSIEQSECKYNSNVNIEFFIGPTISGLNMIHAIYSYNQGDYRSEINQIINTVTITKPEIYPN